MLPNDLPESLITVVAALVMAAVAAFVSARVAFRRGTDAGYRLGWDAMNAKHEEYRRRNRQALEMIQNLTPTPKCDHVRPMGVPTPYTAPAAADDWDWLSNPDDDNRTCPGCRRPRLSPCTDGKWRCQKCDYVLGDVR